MPSPSRGCGRSIARERAIGHTGFGNFSHFRLGGNRSAQLRLLVIATVCGGQTFLRASRSGMTARD